MKAGFSGSHFPQYIFPSLVGRPILRSTNKVYDIDIKDIMLGEEASQLRHMLELDYPMENGIIKNWEDIQYLWDYTFGKEKLNIEPKNCKIMLTEPPLNPSKNREKLVEVFFSIQF